MIECEHRWPYFVTNRGLMTFHCSKHHRPINDDICSTCSDREGEMPKVPFTVDTAFPRRNEEEIQAVYQICKGCPRLHPEKKVCLNMYPEIHPPDIVAQHPSNHCPENKW